MFTFGKPLLLWIIKGPDIISSLAIYKHYSKTKLFNVKVEIKTVSCQFSIILLLLRFVYYFHKFLEFKNIKYT